MAREKKDIDGQQAVKILKLNQLLREKRLTVKELEHKLEVSERTIYRYFKYFESAQIDIERDFDKKYFIPIYDR